MHRGQHFRQIFRDQAGARLARGLAVHPGANAGGLERAHTLRQQTGNHSRENVARTGGGEPGRRVGGDGRAPVR